METDEPGKLNFKAFCVFKPRQFLPAASPEEQSTGLLEVRAKSAPHSVRVLLFSAVAHIPLWPPNGTSTGTDCPVCMHLFCLFETFPLSPVMGAHLMPISVPIHLSWKVTGQRTQPDSLILLAPPNSLSPKALKLQILLCSLSRLPHCDIPASVSFLKQSV